MSLTIHTFTEPPLDNNNYVVIDDQSHEAILIDCSAPDEKIVDYIARQGATLKYILITHAHFDHVLGAGWFMKKYQVPAYLNTGDFPLLHDMNSWLTGMGYAAQTIPELLPLPEQLLIGESPVRVIQTPGHTPGGVCYLIKNHLFAGDTLFKGTHGRVDIPMSNPDAIYESLRMLLQLPEDIIVHPGHGQPTRIGDEKGKY